MKRISRFTLVVLLLLLAKTGFSFNVNPAFLKEHACVPGDRAQQCTVVPGDTLSDFAHALRGNGRSYKDIQAASFIKDANLIYPGMIVVIPDVASPEVSKIATAKMTSVHASTAVTFVSSMFANLNKVLTTGATTEVMSDIHMEEVANTTFSLAEFPTASPKVVMAASTTTKDVVVAKVRGYGFTAQGSDLHGKLQTQLILFNSEEEKRLGLPIERIDLKPSLAASALNGNTVVLVHLKNFPAQPFVLLVGGIATPVDSTQIKAYTGKAPGSHAFAKTMASIGKIGVPATIPFFTGGLILTAAVVGIPQVYYLGVALREKAHEHKLAAKQATVDKSNLALYRASTESETLSKEIAR